MDKELEQFRQEVQRLRAGRAKGSAPYPEVLREFAVRYLAQAQQKGETLKAVVQRLGVSEPTLQVWRRGQTGGGKGVHREPAAAALVPVVVQEPKAAVLLPVEKTVVVVSPQGWRVEGLGVEEAAQLLRGLGC